MKLKRLLKGSILFIMSLSVMTVYAQATSSVTIDKDIIVVKKLIEEASHGRISKSLLLAKVIVRECKRHHVDPLLVLAVMERESSFRIRAVSSKGAVGLMQIMPPTGRMIASSLKLRPHTRRDLFDPIKNTKMGIFYLKKLKKQFNHNKVLYLTAYNMGPNRLNSLRGELNTLEFRYAKSVLKSYKKFKARHVHLMKYLVAKAKN